VLVALTGSEASVADYPFTTLTPNVGMFSLGGFEFEILDLPPFPEDSLDEVHYAAGLKEACVNATILCAVVSLAGDYELQLDALQGHVSGMGIECPSMILGTHADDAPDALEKLKGRFRSIPVFGFPFREGGERAVAEALCRSVGRIVVDARDPVSKEEPLAYALAEGATVMELAEQIHKDLARRGKRAKVWGKSASFDGQEVGMDHVLAAGDTVEIITR
jgi:ribosome-interacting GTPase 1